MKQNVKTSSRLRDGVTWIWSAILCGGLIAAALRVMNVGLLQVPQWVVTVTAFLIMMAGAVSLKAKAYRGITIGGLAVAAALSVAFFSTAAGAIDSPGAIDVIHRGIPYLPLLAGLIALVGALADLESQGKR